MPAIPESGFLVLADLTGYTAYLSRSELEHAPAIAGDLLETVVGRLDPPFRLAKLEGDAAFLFAEDGRADGSLLVDAIEASYLAFRRRLRSIDQASACECNSCRLAPRLDLKLFVHHGSYVRTSIAGREELAGPDVILAHRLLKGVTASTATGGFAQLTVAAVEALGLDPDADGFRPADEDVEHLGQVPAVALDLEARWRLEDAARRLVVPPEEAVVAVDVVVRSDLPTTWAHLTSPALRTLWEGPLEITETSPGGIRGVGTTTQCVTGRLATLEEVVDWQPFEHVAYRVAVPGLGPVEATTDLEPDGAGTSVRIRWRYAGVGLPDAGEVERARRARVDAVARLERLLGHARVPVFPG